MPDQTVSINWLPVSESETFKTHVGKADIGPSQNSSIEVQIDLPSVDGSGEAMLFIQPVGSFSRVVPDGFATRVVNIDVLTQTALIQITRVDSEKRWRMNLRLNLLLIDPKTF